MKFRCTKHFKDNTLYHVGLNLTKELKCLKEQQMSCLFNKNLGFKRIFCGKRAEESIINRERKNKPALRKTTNLFCRYRIGKKTRYALVFLKINSPQILRKKLAARFKVFQIHLFVIKILLF